MDFPAHSKQLPISVKTDGWNLDPSLLPIHAWREQASVDILCHAATPLITVGGTGNEDFPLVAKVRPTPWLEARPDIHRFLSQWQTPIVRCRLARFEGQAMTSSLKRNYYHWFRHRALYVPLVAPQALILQKESEVAPIRVGEVWQVPMQPGWQIVNPNEESAYALVIEVHASFSLLSQKEQVPTTTLVVTKSEDTIPSLQLEKNGFEVLTPEEFHGLTSHLLDSVGKNALAKEYYHHLANKVASMTTRWEQLFSHFGHDLCGELSYRDLLLDFEEQIILPLQREIPIWEDESRYSSEILTSMMTLSPHPAVKRINRHLLAQKRQYSISNTPTHQEEENLSIFTRPIFILSAPRAGSTLLFELLTRFPEIWAMIEESHETIEGIESLHPSAQQYQSNRLTEKEATPATTATLRWRFLQQIQNREGKRYLDFPVAQRPTSIRFLEKTPKNVLRIPFLKAAFPDALFIYLYREPKENISSLMEGWRSRRFVAYAPLPGWPFREWSFFLPQQWQTLTHRSIAEIAAYQWKNANEQILADLKTLPKETWHFVHYNDLIHHPKQVAYGIGQFAGLACDTVFEQTMALPLPTSRLTLSAPAPDKWLRHEQEILALLSPLEAIVIQIETGFLC